jgi:integrase
MRFLDRIRLFCKVIFAGGPAAPNLSDITDDHVRTYADTLPKLPPKIRLNDTRPMDAIIRSSTKQMSAKTRFPHVQAVHMFLKYCNRQGYPVPAGLEGILQEYLIKSKKPSKAEKKKRAYTPEELNLILVSAEYRDGTFKRPSDFWAPLIALFTGAREGEILQLRVADVYQDAKTGIWLFNIDEEDGNRTKNENSVRVVPIHDQLKTLGWLDYVASVKSAGGLVLFPDDYRNPNGLFSGFSKRYNRYRLE